jgi:beta-glucanase (GH16 family)
MNRKHGSTLMLSLRVFLLFILATASRLHSQEAVSAHSSPQPVGQTGDRWILQTDFSDEFNDVQLDLKKWDSNCKSWGGWTWDPQNAWIRDGFLNLQMRTEPRNGGTAYASGMVKTKAKPILYGYFEARLKAAARFPGVCPAFWGFRPEKKTWSEIDFVELTEQAQNPRMVDTNTHLFRHPGLVAGQEIHEHRTWKAPWDPRDDFHVYGCEWDENTIRWFVDGKLIQSRQNDYWHQPLDIALSLGLRDPLKQTPSEAGFPTVCQVDYIRAWKAAKPIPAELDAAVTYPDLPATKTVGEARFYAEAVPQPWRGIDDVIDGFDWSLPPTVKPSPQSWIKKLGASPKTYPGNLLGIINTTWANLEPEEGRYEFSGIQNEIRKLKEKGFRGIELHIRGSVWEVAYYDDKGALTPPEKLTPAQQASRRQAISAPRWLANHRPPTALTEPQPGKILPGSRLLVNCDIFQPDYHQRYLKLIEALAKTGIPQAPELAVVYIHMVSSSGGEENDGATPDDKARHPFVVERLKAWSAAFGSNARKLVFTGANPENLSICYGLGMGQRNGFVERYLLHASNPGLGQSLDPAGYLITDETLPPIAENRIFGDENEEYDPASELHVARFGPVSTWNHRYREATLRALQMRRNCLWEPALSPDPYLSAFLANELGRQINDAPDAWCYLRESYVHEGNQWKGKAIPVKNFERWLYQRDTPGHETWPVHRVLFQDVESASLASTYVQGCNYDYVARQGKRFGFALDDRFLAGEPAAVAIKVTYYDEAPWKLVYPSATGPRERSVPSRGDGALRTATFFLNDAVFTAKGMKPDLEIQALKTPATIRFLRIIRLPTGQPKEP